MGDWTAEFYEDSAGTAPFQEFMDDLDEITRTMVDAAIRKVLEERGPALAGTSWMKHLGDGLSEFRIRHTSKEIDRLYQEANKPRPRGPQAVLVRVFVHFHGNKVCLLLGGYDKGDDPSGKKQQREIATARKRLADFKRRQLKKDKAAKGKR